MYERHFGLKTKPFSLTPDPAFLYLSRQHTMAATMLEYGMESQASFMLLTGDIGSGKTTLVRWLLRRLGKKTMVGLISNTHGSFGCLQDWILSALEIAPSDDSAVAKYEALVDCCVREYAEGRRTLLVLDEAQNLSVEVLEELRLLSNVNSEADLVLQVLLVGQPELRDTLSRSELHQFAQRISVNFHLESLDRSETHEYIQHRLEVAGGRKTVFHPEAIEFIFARTKGVPRLLNQLCDMALVYAYAEARTTVDAELVSHVVRDQRYGFSNRSPSIDSMPCSIAPRYRSSNPEEQRHHGQQQPLE